METYELKLIQAFLAIGEDRFYPWVCIHCESRMEKQDIRNLHSTNS